MKQEAGKEQPKPEVVHIGEKFYLFDPIRTESGWNPHFNIVRYESRILLETRLRLPIAAYTRPTFDILRLEGITPYNPEAGYSISQTDFNWETRIRKLKQLRGELGDLKVDSSKAPLAIIIAHNPLEEQSIELYDISKGEEIPDFTDIEPSDLISRVLEYSTLPEEERRRVFKHTWHYPFKADVIEVLKRLHVELISPVGRFESKPSLRSQKSATLAFNCFYPFGNPLPVEGHDLKEMGLTMEEGFYLCVPSNLDQLSQIQARFILAPEEGQEARPPEQ